MDTVEVPDRSRASALLELLGVSQADAEEILAVRPDPYRSPRHWSLFQRRCQELRSDLGGFGTLDGWPDIPGPDGRYFYVWVFLSSVPALQEFHAARGIPPEIGWATMAELGTQLFYHRSIHGTGGLDAQRWLTAHFRGVLYRVGRLLYERQRSWFDAEGGPLVGEPAVGIHIPRGRLTPASCDESLTAAATFFARHFPEEQPCRYATCVSWVLDPQLADYLAADSNIVRFQRRFALVSEADVPVADRATVEAVFARRWRTAAELPRRTSLERALADHLEAGGHWHYRTGWLRLPTP